MGKRFLLALAGLALALWISSATAQAELIYAVTVTNTLISFDSATPATVTVIGPITGLQAFETIFAIDLRPATGQLYALGGTSRLYTINPATAVATQVGSAGAFTLSGSFFGFDFNPIVDRIRVVSDADQNLRLNPNDGTLTATDTPLNPGNPSVDASAYTNNFTGALTTTLYGMDSSSDVLVIQNPPNSGTLTTVGSLGVNATFPIAFDISGTSGIAYAAFAPAGGSGSSLFTINLTTGAATLVGSIGSVLTVAMTVGVQGITPTPTPTATAAGVATATPTSTPGLGQGAVQVPTLSGWAMLGMILAIGAAGYFLIRGLSSSG